VSFAKGERVFADFAINNCVKDPAASFRYLLPLIGQQVRVCLSVLVSVFYAEHTRTNTHTHTHMLTAGAGGQQGGAGLQGCLSLL
jgi:hypothetical protein